LILWCFAAIVLVQGTSTTTKIKNSEKDLSAAFSAKKKASRHLDKIASDIVKVEKDIAYLEYKIEVLSEDEDKTQKEYEVLKSELVLSEETLSRTSREIEEKRKAFISLLSEQFSVIFAMQQFKHPTQKSIISYEVYKACKKYNTKELAVLKHEITLLEKRKKNKRYQYDKTKKAIREIIKKKSLIKKKS